MLGASDQCGPPEPGCRTLTNEAASLMDEGPLFPTVSAVCPSFTRSKGGALSATAKIKLSNFPNIKNAFF